MPQSTLTILHDDLNRTETLTKRVRTLAPWRERDGVCLHWLSIDDARHDTDALPNQGVVWILLDYLTPGAVDDLIEQLVERRLPVLLTSNRDRLEQGEVYAEGVTVCDPHEPMEIVQAMLQALMSQTQTLQTLNIESKLLRLESDGISEQMGRMNDELRLAAQLQKEYLRCEPPKLDHVRFSSLSRAASFVCGDMFDIQRLDEKHVGLFIADAVGHGMPAALMTMFMKRALTTKIIDPHMHRGYRLLEPAESMARINRDMIACQSQTDQVRFATACYGVLDTESMELRIARAGHPFPLVFKKNGRTRTIEPAGGLLSVFPEEVFEQERVFLEPGDRLILYTDGFELAFAEEQPEIDRYGRPRLRCDTYLEAFETLREGTLEQGIARIQREVDSTSGSLSNLDDLTMIGVEIC